MNSDNYIDPNGEEIDIYGEPLGEVPADVWLIREQLREREAERDDKN